MGVGSIPRSRISEYLSDELGLAGAVHDRAMAILRRTDDAYVGMANAPPGTNSEADMADSAKATDAEGVRRVMRGLGNRFKQSRKPKMK